MISIAEAQDIIRENLPERQIEHRRLPELPGTILAAPIAALEPSPRYTNSAMDGFAVRWADISDVGEGKPVSLKIVGESQAGIPFRGMLQAGQTARISTGAMICQGADAVVPIEEVELDGDTLRVLKAKKQHQHLRFQGEEFSAGEPLLASGTRLGPSQIALLASQGITSAPIFRTPGVAIILTGSELVPYDSDPEEWQIRDSNGIMLETAVGQSGGTVSLSTHVGDNYDDTVAAVRKAMDSSQLIIFSGGVSVGPHDLVKKAAGECGFETLFWRVRQKPGKPLFFARKGDTLFFGLPGNPVSAYMCYQYYLHPVLQHLRGGPFTHPSTTATVAEAFGNKLPRAQLFRVAMQMAAGQWQVRPLARQGSHMLSTVSEADGFVVLETAQSYEPRDKVEVIRLNTPW